MRINLRSVGAFGAATIVVAGMVVAGAGAASAATSLGSLTGAPASGDTGTPFSVKTSGACPAQTESILGYINGPGWTNIVGIGNNSTDVQNVDSTGVPLADNLAGIAQANGVALVNGTYNFSLLCQDELGTNVFGQYDGSYTVTGTSYVFNAVAAPASTTTLSVTPNTPQTVGTSVTLSATVTSTATVAGTVQFKADGDNLGAAVPVAAGAASLTTTELTGGTHSLTAVFIPTTPASIAGSTSAAKSYTINAPAAPTTTTLSSSPSAPTTADVVSLTAALTPANAAGSVAFKEGSTTVGTATVSGGSASVSLTGLSAGTHSYTAVFTPSNVANFVASTSSASTVTVVAFAGASDTETITTKVEAGTLIITAGGPTVDLGTLALNATNSLLVSTPKDINPVVVTDTRAGNLGWNVNGSVGDFANSAGDKISSANLGWTPKVVASQPVQEVTAGPVVAAGSGIAVGAASTDGLKASRLLGKATVGKSIGTAQLGASLVLQAPTSAKPGQYNTTLTLTAI